jgi:hypothetical protein
MIIRNHDLKDKPLAWWCIVSCNNVAPVTNFVSAELQRSINLNKVVATFEKHIFLSKTDLTRTGIISNSYNEMFEA